ncbi:MAG: methionyl-tRNA formyltransferase [Sphingomonas taxi]|uniref:Methionyl-tRNA formyltransferase n=1 Tax=Sphingomonas taxi TaxID=1549858 RepID=A0A2W5P802_9SPHN|nr:MAG: methionyl-tRNA formyltransferase [Sphingomonas taxi]
MRIIFMGTPAFAVPTLNALVADGHDVVAVYSQPPRPGGRRGRGLVRTPVHQRADELGIAVHTPVSLKDAAAQAAFSAHAADVAVVAAYGLILPHAVLAAPPLGCLNVHGSLLPRWRGAAPVQRAILAGDAETGVGIMQMETGLDTGPVRLEGRVPCAGKNAGQITDELAQLGAILMVQVLRDPAAYPPVAQSTEGVTYAGKIRKEEARLDFTADAAQVLRQIAAFDPAPGAFFEHDGERIKVLAAERSDRHGAAGAVLDDRLLIACGDGAIRPLHVQRAGRGAMDVDELLRGFAIPAGTRL